MQSQFSLIGFILLWFLIKNSGEKMKPLSKIYTPFNLLLIKPVLQGVTRSLQGFSCQAQTP